MGKHVFKLPDVGEGVVEGEIVKWNVKPGDTVKEDEPLVELMTDKATVAIPSPVNGTVVSTTGKLGEMIPIGAELIVFDDEKYDEIRVKEALKREKYLDYDKAIEIYEEINMPEEVARVRKLKAALKREKYLDYDKAIEIYEEINMPEEAARVRKLKAKQGAVKVDQTVVHGDYVDDRDTIVKDSVINRSNVGAGGDDKFTKLKELTEMKEKGFIDDDEFKQMKKEILEK